MGDFFQTLRSLLGLEETPDQKRLRESLERPPAKRGVPPMLKRPPRPASFLGEAPQSQSTYRDGSALMPAPLLKIKEPMKYLDQRQLQQNIEKMDEPGATVIDNLPVKPMTPEEEKKLRDDHNDRGFMYRPPIQVSPSQIPSGTMTVGPLKSRGKRGK